MDSAIPMNHAVRVRQTAEHALTSVVTGSVLLPKTVLHALMIAARAPIPVETVYAAPPKPVPHALTTAAHAQDAVTGHAKRRRPVLHAPTTVVHVLAPVAMVCVPRVNRVPRARRTVACVQDHAATAYAT